MSFLVLFTPIGDYFKIHKRVWIHFLIPLVGAICSFLVMKFYPLKSTIDIDEVFLNFLNVQISGIAILISFSIAIITILVSSESDNLKNIKEEMAKENEPYQMVKDNNGLKMPTLFQILLSSITYNTLVQIIFLLFLFLQLLLQTICSSRTIKILICLDVFFILHILFVLWQSISHMYLVFWKRS